MLLSFAQKERTKISYLHVNCSNFQAVNKLVIQVIISFRNVMEVVYVRCPDVVSSHSNLVD